MKVELSPEVENLVQEKMKSGNYESENAVLVEALRQMEERDKLREREIATLRQMIQDGIDSVKNGGWIDGETFMDELEAEIDADIEAEKNAKRRAIHV